MCRDTPTRRLGMSRPPDARARDALVDLRARLDDATRGACLAAYWRAVRAACDDAQRMGAETFARGRKRVDDEAARAFGASRSAMATHATLMETLAARGARERGASGRGGCGRGRRGTTTRERGRDEDERRRAETRERWRRGATSDRERIRDGGDEETEPTGGESGEGERDADGAGRAAGRIESESRRHGRSAHGGAIAREISGGESRDGARNAGARGRGESFGGGGEGAREGRRETSDGAPRARARGRRHAVDVVAVESIGFESAHRGGDSRGDGRGDRLIRDAKRGVRARRDPRGVLRYLFLIETKF